MSIILSIWNHSTLQILLPKNSNTILESNIIYNCAIIFRANGILAILSSSAIIVIATIIQARTPYKASASTYAPLMKITILML